MTRVHQTPAPSQALGVSRYMILAAAAIAGLTAFTATSRATIVIPTSAGIGADAGIREDQPESQQGTTTSTELTVRVAAGQNRHSIIRFDLTGITVADLQGQADLLLTYQRSGVAGGTNAGGIKIYGVNPANALAATWNEATVRYRDAGDQDPATPVGAHPRSQPAVGTPAANVPPSPVYVANAPSWNSNAADGTRAPGFRHENPTYSAAAEATNTTRFNNNTVVKAAYDADLADNGVIDSGPYTYQSYINQPAYTDVAVSGNYPDLLSFDRPMSTVGADINDASFLGYLDYDAKAARVGGTVMSFTGDRDFSPINHGPADQAANNAALVNYLTNLINGGYTSATFILMQKNAIDADTLPVRNDNLIFASKEFVPAGGVAGDWAPKLVLAPEPGSCLAMLGLGAMALIRRRK